MTKSEAEIPIDAFTAVLLGDFSENQCLILAAVIPLAYGKPSRLTNESRLNKMLDISPKAIRRALNELIESSVITENEDGFIVFSDNWESWLRSAPKERGAWALSPRLGDMEVAHIRRFLSM